jgi:hypothetical protein
MVWGCQEDGSSVTGFVFKVLSRPVSWCAKKQSTMALCTGEAEYFALSYAVQEPIGFRHLLKHLGNFQLEATPIYVDNQACIKMAKNYMVQVRTKHTNIRYHRVWRSQAHLLPY